MITTETIYVATCDGCGEQWTTPNDGLGYIDKDNTIDGLIDSEWHITKEEKCYCHNCHFIEEGGEVIIEPQNQPTDDKL